MSRGIEGKEMCSHERESRYEKEDTHEGKMIAFIPVGPQTRVNARNCLLKIF